MSMYSKTYDLDELKFEIFKVCDSMNAPDGPWPFEFDYNTIVNFLTKGWFRGVGFSCDSNGVELPKNSVSLQAAVEFCEKFTHEGKSELCYRPNGFTQYCKKLFLKGLEAGIEWSNQEISSRVTESK